MFVLNVGANKEVTDEEENQCCAGCKVGVLNQKLSVSFTDY